MAWVDGINFDKLQQEQRHVAVIEGKKILFIWHLDKVHAVQSQCPHFKLPLTKGKITDECAIVCPFHKSEFDLQTGDVKCWSTFPPVIGSLLGKLSKPEKLHIYQTRIHENSVQVEL